MRTYVCINPPFVANEPIDAHTCIIYLCVQDFHTSFRFLHVRSKYMLNTILSVHSRVLSHVKKLVVVYYLKCVKGTHSKYY